MHMHIDLFKIVFLPAELFQPGTADGHGRLGRLLHHIAELTGEQQPALALEQRHLDIEYLPPHLGPGQTGGQAGLVNDIDFRLRLVLGRPEILAEGAFVDRIGTFAAFGNTARHLAADLADLPLQVTQPGLLGVIGDHETQGFVVKL